MEGTGKSRDAARRRRNPRPVSVVLASDPVGLLNLVADESGLRLGAPIRRRRLGPSCPARARQGRTRGAGPGLDTAGPAAHARTQRFPSAPEAESRPC